MDGHSEKIGMVLARELAGALGFVLAVAMVLTLLGSLVTM